MLQAKTLLSFYYVLPFVVTPQYSSQPLACYSSNLPWSMPLYSPFNTLQTLAQETIQTSIKAKRQLASTNSPQTGNQVNPDTPKFSKRIKNKRKGIASKERQSAKKNSESNLIHQMFSYYVKQQQQSLKMIKRAVASLNREKREHEKIIRLFYQTMKVIYYMHGRRYMNKETILKFFMPQKFIEHMPNIYKVIQEKNVLSIDELCLLLRIATSHFIQNIDIVTILTSKRITNVSRYEHLRRRRVLLHSFNNKK